ncbi:hypothetical protein E2C01_058114 [Portunus trituberculatus]|uniref:Uncharacterized protein n=1 Tax=Portunus trituberculatus TaxID=210409 RepID=A0A5B7H567_PORTR|nr:hypothetical protein [Portunus trituberculatus]
MLRPSFTPAARIPWLRSMVLKPMLPPRLCLFPLIFGRTVTPARSILSGLCSAGSGSLAGGESGSTRHPRESGSSPGRSTRELYTSLASSDMLDCVGANKRQQKSLDTDVFLYPDGEVFRMSPQET